MKREMELLAPGGDVACIKAAILAGANAIYCGLGKFNARNRAENISFGDLKGIIRLAHKNNCQVFLTLNIIVVESELPALFNLLNKLINTKIDAVIVQDLGVFYLLSHYFPGLNIHASTQLTTHNEGQIKFLSTLKATRVNLSRELSLQEIKTLATTSHENGLLTEVFVHGSNCLCFSGICYLSSVHGGNSGNRGRCSQPCRDQYLTTAEGNNFPLNLKDNSAYSNLKELSEAGVDSIKIEGRIKQFHYVYTVIHSYRKQLQRLHSNTPLKNDDSDLHNVFNRNFSNAFLQGNINKNMFVDNPRDNSAVYLAELKGGPTEENIEKAKRELYDLKTAIITTVKQKIAKLNIEKAPITITVSGKAGTPIKISVQTPETSFIVLSECNLVDTVTYSENSHLSKTNEKRNNQFLNEEMFRQRFKAINDSEYFIKRIELENLHSDLFLPFKELATIKKKIVYILNGSKETIVPSLLQTNTTVVSLKHQTSDTPPLDKQSVAKIKPVLSLLISSQKDLHLCNETSADIYFQLPNSFSKGCDEFVDLFRKNNIIPWFPSILIGKDYHAALDFLDKVQAKRLVTNNTGIAYEAYRRGISWIAGPYLNIANSFSLLCLKENFNCYGSFISNELNKNQIQRIKKPNDFKLYYSIYQPIVLLTSRQCLFQQVTGCAKDTIDKTCIQQCEKFSSITNLKEADLLIKKTKGNYHCLYNDKNFLNTDIATDIPDIFASFFIDLSNIHTDTQISGDKLTIISFFENLLNGTPNSAEELRQNIHPTTQNQYQLGI